MGSPTPHIDPKVEAVIEETRRFLEPRVRTGGWKADLGSHVGRQQAALFEIYSNSSVPQWVKDEVSGPIVEAMKKRHPGRPTRRFRDGLIAAAASRIVKQIDENGTHYNPSRNDETHDKECAASIIQKALARLGVTMEEKEIKTIVLKTPVPLGPQRVGHILGRNTPPD